MRSADLEVLAQAISWQQQGLKPLLLTVAQTWGSAPRPIGSLLAITPCGLHAGSVSGGCVEEDILQRCQAGEWQYLSQAAELKYGVSQGDAARFGLPCGGELALIIEPFLDFQHWQSVYYAVQRGELLLRTLNMATGVANLLPATMATPSFAVDGEFIAKLYGPQWRMLLIGANHLARYVAQFALALDYQVQVCDPRANHRLSWDLADAPLVAGMPDDVVRALGHYQRTIILTLTHDPKLDDMALMEALNTDAFYIGALGSKLSSANRRERMQELGISAANIARLVAPVGLDIGSRTPAEIAIAIMADITQRRNKAPHA